VGAALIHSRVIPPSFIRVVVHKGEVHSRTELNIIERKGKPAKKKRGSPSVGELKPLLKGLEKVSRKVTH